MDVLVYILIVGITYKEISYFTPRMIFTHKSLIEWLLFLIGIALLVYLTVKYAHDWRKIAFGACGVIAFSAMWLKQGVSENGVLVKPSRFIKEFYPWATIGSVNIDKKENAVVLWRDQDGILLIKQRFLLNDLPLLCERIREKGIKDISGAK